MDHPTPHHSDDGAPGDTGERLRLRGGLVAALVPVAVFFLGAIVYFVILGAFDTNGLTVAGSAGLLVGAFLAHSTSRYWQAAARGVGSETSANLLLILLFASVFAALIATTGVSDGFVWLAEALTIGGPLFVPAVFLITCAIATSTGTSIGTLFTAFPVFFPAGLALGADPALLAGAILSGALFGDNLAPISDSTVVSASTQRYRTRPGVADVGGVVRARLRYSLPAAAIAVVLFTVVSMLRGADGAAAVSAGAGPDGLIMLAPIVVMLTLATWKRDIFLALGVGTAVGVVVGLASGTLTRTEIVSLTEGGEAGGFFADGLRDVLPLLGLGIVVFGMIGILRDAGFFDWVIGAITSRPAARTPRGAELSIGLGAVVTCTFFASVNGPSMMMFGPVADRVGAAAGLHPYRRSNVMDCFTLGFGSIIPLVSSFLLISSQLTAGYEGTAQVSPLTLFTVCFYPLALTAVILFAVLTGWGRRYEGPDGSAVTERPAVTEPIGTAP